MSAAWRLMPGDLPPWHTVYQQTRRFFAWRGNYRRLVVRYERHADNFLCFVHLGCILTLLRYL